MKVLVPVKRVVDYTVKIRVLPNKKGVDKKTVRMSMNPFCEIAVEEAVRLKEANIASELIAVTIGNKKSSEQLRTAMAMGIDRSIHILTDIETDIHLQPINVCRILSQIINTEKPDLIIMGKQSIDDDSNQTSQMLAGKLGLSQATFASNLELVNDNKSIIVSREIDGGCNKLKVNLPAIISCDLRLNEPRFATLQNIMKARKKSIQEINLDDLVKDHNIDIISKLDYMEINEPQQRKGGTFVESVDELFQKLKENQCI